MLNFMKQNRNKNVNDKNQHIVYNVNLPKLIEFFIKKPVCIVCYLLSKIKMISENKYLSCTT